MLKTLASAALAITIIVPPAFAQSPAWVEAKANVASVKQRPTLLDGPGAKTPESEKALGHHGPVVIEGILSIDGRLTEARVEVSSKAPVLDDVALAAANATTFTPARDANGAPIAIVISVPFSLVGYKSETGGVFEYKCGQFVRDMDWWKSVNPDRPFSEHELHKLELGMMVSQALLSIGGDSREKMKSIGPDFDIRWQTAIERCRKNPSMLQKDAVFR